MMLVLVIVICLVVMLNILIGWVRWYLFMNWLFWGSGCRFWVMVFSGLVSSGVSVVCLVIFWWYLISVGRFKVVVGMDVMSSRGRVICSSIKKFLL